MTESTTTITIAKPSIIYVPTYITYTRIISKNIWFPLIAGKRIFTSVFRIRIQIMRIRVRIKSCRFTELSSFLPAQNYTCQQECLSPPHRSGYVGKKEVILLHCLVDIPKCVVEERPAAAFGPCCLPNPSPLNV